jgi:hypothetical protein
VRLQYQQCRSALDPAALLQVRITPLTTKRVEHSGIKVQLLGQIELASERGSPHDFVSLGALTCGSLQQQPPEHEAAVPQSLLHCQVLSAAMCSRRA